MGTGLAGRQEGDREEASRAKPCPDVNPTPGRMELLDLTSAWVTAGLLELAAPRLLPATGQKGCSRIEDGVPHDTAGPTRFAVFCAGVDRAQQRPGRFTEIVTVMPRQRWDPAVVLVAIAGDDHLRAHRGAA